MLLLLWSGSIVWSSIAWDTGPHCGLAERVFEDWEEVNMSSFDHLIENLVLARCFPVFSLDMALDISMFLIAKLSSLKFLVLLSSMYARRLVSVFASILSALVIRDWK